MRAALIGLVALVILLGGTFMGVAALLILPLVGIIALIALLVWFAQRRAQHKPPIR